MDFIRNFSSNDTDEKIKYLIYSEDIRYIINKDKIAAGGLSHCLLWYEINSFNFTNFDIF